MVTQDGHLDRRRQLIADASRALDEHLSGDKRPRKASKDPERRHTTLKGVKKTVKSY
jgi:hypothetical protein